MLHISDSDFFSQIIFIAFICILLIYSGTSYTSKGNFLDHSGKWQYFLNINILLMIIDSH